jgi:hypothetical protein
MGGICQEYLAADRVTLMETAPVEACPNAVRHVGGGFGIPSIKEVMDVAEYRRIDECVGGTVAR